MPEEIPQQPDKNTPSALVEQVTIRGLRGIGEVALKELAPLTIIVGRNGTRKSTLLDGLLIAASHDPADAVGRVVRRRGGIRGGVRWLFAGGEPEAAPISLEVARTGVARRTTVEWAGMADSARSAAVFGEEHPGPYVRLRVNTYANLPDPLSPDGLRSRSFVVSAADNAYTYSLEQGDIPRVSYVRMLDASEPYDPRPITDAVSRLRAVGLRERADAVLAAIAERAADGRELTIGSEDGIAYLMLAHEGRGVPLPAAGDGARALVRGTIELIQSPSGLFLYEEPELHLHPGAQRELAKVMSETVMRGVQLVLTTHSLELIDFLLAAMHEQLHAVAVFTTSMVAGKLITTRIPGPDAAFAREQIDEDLR